MMLVSGEIRIGVTVELCQGVLDGRRMPDDWALSVVVPIFKEQGDTMNCMATACNEDSRNGANFFEGIALG